MHTVGSAGLAVRDLLGMLVAICIGHALPTCIVQLAGVKLINYHYPAPGCQPGYQLLDRAPDAQKAPCILIAPVPKSHCGLVARLGCQRAHMPAKVRSAITYLLNRSILKGLFMYQPSTHGR